MVSLCNLLEIFIHPGYGFNVEEKLDNKKRYISYSYAFAFIWSMGCTINDQHIDKFDDHIRGLFQSIIFSNSDNVYGFFFDPQDIVFKSWNEITPEFVYDKDTAYFNMIVPTHDVIKIQFIMTELVSNKKHIFLTGQSGTGKSSIVSSLLNKIKEENAVDKISMIFSA